MSYSVPDEDTVADAILIVMHKNPQIGSQNEMLELVRRELNRQGGDHRISGERMRRIALNRKMVSLRIDYHETDDPELPERCPVCQNPMSPVTNRTLDGSITEVRRKCTMCPYSVGSRKRIPGRYAFSKRGRT
ncbi:MAG: hypothetical protein RBQ77_01540 [Candidatus Methanomethylophilaceae archaeon]|jgi:hypothetical protein|nr:hypothetical protein [Candidatus Methanomethylophilaceae archaeon]NLF33481.1 hypothetical protein [Thermoplasmatales archaeon]